MKIWVTKYALTEGILEFDREERPHVQVLGAVTVVNPSGLNGISWFRGQDWHTTREAAIFRARGMRDAKIVSLDKQIQKLNKLSWRV